MGNDKAIARRLRLDRRVATGHSELPLAGEHGFLLQYVNVPTVYN